LTTSFFPAAVCPAGAAAPRLTLKIMPAVVGLLPVPLVYDA
jgi:hypothetical protein